MKLTQQKPEVWTTVW